MSDRSSTRAGAAAWLIDRGVAAALKLRRKPTRYRVERGVPMQARDGVVLLADHYTPGTSQSRGTILMRGPYGRGFPGDLLEARVYAGQGYHVLLQSSRGTFGSGGTLNPMAQEAEDAQDVVRWLRSQDWFDGRLATAGGSYLGWTQWALMMDPPPELRTAVVTVGFHDLGEYAWGTGDFLLSDLLSWTSSVVYQEALSPVRALVNNLRAVKLLRPITDRTDFVAAAAEHGVGRLGPWFGEWASHPDPDDPFWSAYRADDALDKVDVPIRLISGWQDVFLHQTLRQYEVLTGRGVDVRLTVGPWKHSEVGTKGAGLVTRNTLDWLDTHLAGDEPVGVAQSQVDVFVTGAGRPEAGRDSAGRPEAGRDSADRWRSLPDWPPTTTPSVLHLAAHGRLVTDPSSGVDDRSTFVYDPADPTPSVGGRTLTADGGVTDNRTLENRSDVVVFTSDVLADDLEVLGVPIVELVHSSDNPHADLFVRLSDVDPSGKSHNFSDAFVRLDPDSTSELRKVELRLDPCAHRLAAGHRLRLVVSGGAHPRYAFNPGTGAPVGTVSPLKRVEHRIHHGSFESRVVLPTYIEP